MERLASVSGLKCSDSPLHGTYNLSLSEADGVGLGQAMLFANGQMVFYSEKHSIGEVGMGEWNALDETSFEFGADVWSVLGGSREIVGGGTIGEDALVADYTGNGRLVASPVPSFQHYLSAVRMAGVYSIHDATGTFSGTINFGSDGKISGTTSEGCKFDGAYWIPNSIFNQAQLTLGVSDCANAGTINAAANYNDEAGSIIMMGSDGSQGHYWTLIR
jgi:hypothetical protein